MTAIRTATRITQIGSRAMFGLDGVTIEVRGMMPADATKVAAVAFRIARIEELEAGRIEDQAEIAGLRVELAQLCEQVMKALEVESI